MLSRPSRGLGDLGERQLAEEPQRDHLAVGIGQRRHRVADLAAAFGETTTRARIGARVGSHRLGQPRRCRPSGGAERGGGRPGGWRSASASHAPTPRRGSRRSTETPPGRPPASRLRRRVAVRGCGGRRDRSSVSPGRRAGRRPAGHPLARQRRERGHPRPHRAMMAFAIRANATISDRCPEPEVIVVIAVAVTRVVVVVVAVAGTRVVVVVIVVVVGVAGTRVVLVVVAVVIGGAVGSGLADALRTRCGGGGRCAGGRRWPDHRRSRRVSGDVPAVVSAEAVGSGLADALAEALADGDGEAEMLAPNVSSPAVADGDASVFVPVSSSRSLPVASTTPAMTRRPPTARMRPRNVVLMFTMVELPLVFVRRDEERRSPLRAIAAGKGFTWRAPSAARPGVRPD